MNNDKLTDGLEAQGIYTIEIIRDGKNGPEVIQRRVVPNLVVNTGKRQLWRQATGVSSKVFNFMRIGTCGATTNSGQTNVISPVTGTLDAVDSKTLLSGTRTFQWVNSYASGSTSKSAAGIKEICVLNQSTSPGGSALSRSTFAAVSKSKSDKLKISYSARIT